MKLIRTLNADEIECRLQQIKTNGYLGLLYKDARCDMKILDETFGIFGWKREHETINGNLFCTVSIWNELTGQWVSKQDVGTESNTEKEKGQASDSFKRACFNIGIGRELYTAPFIWIKPLPGEIQDGNKVYTKFNVSEIEYNEQREITKLKIIDQDNVERFKYSKGNYNSINKKPVDKPKPTNKPVNQENKTTKQNNNHPFKCSECGDEITEKVYNYSMTKYKAPLCMKHQK